MYELNWLMSNRFFGLSCCLQNGFKLCNWNLCNVFCSLFFRNSIQYIFSCHSTYKFGLKASVCSHTIGHILIFSAIVVSRD